MVKTIQSKMMVMLVTVLVGVVVGLLAGIFSGVGNTFLLIAFYSMLSRMPADQLLVLYASVSMASQFSGSVSALAYGIMGEATSMPALQERKTLADNGMIACAIKNTAHASLLAVPMVLIMSSAAYYLLPSLVYVLRTETVVFFQLCMLILALLWCNNRIDTNAILVITGTALGSIGVVTTSGQKLLTLGVTGLSDGIPLIALMVGLIALPAGIDIVRTRLQPAAVKNDTTFDFPTAAALRGSLIGAIAGLIPAVGNTVCSQLAWRIERHFAGDDHHHHSLQRLTSAEAANNSSAVAVMLPLMMFGIPIVSSEVVLFSILQSNGWMASMVTVKLLLMLAMAFLLSAVVSWILCGFNVQRLVQGISKYATLVVIFTLVFASFGVISTGISSYSGWFYGIILLLAGIVGVLGKRLDFTPLVLSFLAAPTLVTGISTLTQLYL